MKYIYTYIFYLFLLQGKTQTNLVSNGSFETYSSCPTGFSSIALAIGWNTPSNNAPEYFNVCSAPYDVDIPLNCLSYQIPKTGNAYSGIFIYGYDSDTIEIHNEYIQTQLTQTLSAGTCYYFEMYYSLSNVSGYGSNRLQALLTSMQFTTDLSMHYNNLQTQIELDSTTYITDTLNWVKLSGTFTATGGEKYLTIGNFKDKAHTKRVSLNTNFVSPCGSGFANNFCYIYIDDVSLYDCSSIGLKENSKENLFKVYPNPAVDQLYVEADGYETINIKLYTIIGELVIDKTITKNMALDINGLSSGTYIYRVFSNGNILNTGKLIINK